jgi:uncharacterized protein (DUF983 family)
MISVWVFHLSVDTYRPTSEIPSPSSSVKLLIAMSVDTYRPTWKLAMWVAVVVVVAHVSVVVLADVGVQGIVVAAQTESAVQTN